jgi:NAD(P)-dependent dehydrogenase (short-subunit alcohol dehydrogenase family)
MSKTIVITGVTKGLGRALAECYIAHGHTDIGCGRSSEVLELRFTHPPPHDFSVVDVAEENKVLVAVGSAVTAIWAWPACFSGIRTGRSFCP